jgi:hypothetical protein
MYAMTQFRNKFHPPDSNDSLSHRRQTTANKNILTAAILLFNILQRQQVNRSHKFYVRMTVHLL